MGRGRGPRGGGRDRGDDYGDNRRGDRRRRGDGRGGRGIAEPVNDHFDFPPGHTPGTSSGDSVEDLVRDGRASAAAQRAANDARRRGRDQGAAETVVTRDGREFTDVSSDTAVDNRDIRGIIDELPPDRREDHHGHCAFPRAVQQGLDQGMSLDDFRGASLGGAWIDAPGPGSRHGKYAPPCDSCVPLADALDIRRARH